MWAPSKAQRERPVQRGLPEQQGQQDLQDHKAKQVLMA